MNARHRRSEAGQELAEAALTIPILIVLLLGILDLGRGVYAYSVVANAAREGARAAVVVVPTDGVDYQSAIYTAAHNRAEALAVGVSLDAFTVTEHGSIDNPKGHTIVVYAAHEFTLIAPLYNVLLAGESFMIGSYSTMHVEY
jgi:Flp pilus assembly protein TadG